MPRATPPRRNQLSPVALLLRCDRTEEDTPTTSNRSSTSCAQAFEISRRVPKANSLTCYLIVL